jgi:hypothetical protein
MFIDLDEAMTIHFHTCTLEPQIRRIRRPPRRRKHMAAQQTLRRAVALRDADDNLRQRHVRHLPRRRARVHVHPGVREDLLDLAAHVGVFFRQQVRRLLDDADFRPEAAHHLPELDADDAAADDRDVPRHLA